MKDQSKNRLALIHQRFARHAPAPESSRETFERAFERTRDEVIRPVMEEIAAELRALGHAPEISVDPVDHEGRTCSPAIALRLGIRGVTGRRNHVVFAVIHWKIGNRPTETQEVLAFHGKDETPFDLFRYMSPGEITKDVVEQVLVDSIEGLFAQNAR